MAGDADCAFMSETASDDVVMCYDKDMKSTGTRRAMSDIQVQAWYSKQEQSSSSSTTTVKCKSLTVFNAPITEHAYSCPIGTIPVR
ncbi:hypothetical protein BCS96_11440 [Vibrio breoganii]|nr:hypothetical protein BCU93_07390 [Vibrio breoganii]PMG90238.1 hypothetical protein BCU81_06870 [Vibrio breoganii]PML84851.1 hypothetical protein BCT68_00560 [Vibrio breoganii]PMM44961.1 hypothetical protein BCT52_09960 [Vibrio breoganii]PMO92318.1 hypothetical protein BCS98_10055 [Vibrio breoganii]